MKPYSKVKAPLGYLASVSVSYSNSNIGEIGLDLWIQPYWYSEYDKAKPYRFSCLFAVIETDLIVIAFGNQ